MRKDPTEFRNRFKRWKETGESQYEAGLPKFATGAEGIKKVYAPYYDTDGTLIRNVYAELPELVVTGHKKDYTKLAEQERSRQLGVAKSFLREGPSISNLFNAANAAWNGLTTSSADINPYIQTGDAPSPGMRNPREIVKSTKTIGQLFRTDARTLVDNDLDLAAQYNRLRSFLTSDGYKARLLNYYRDKGSSIITQNVAPEQRVGEQLYNIETARATVKPRGKLVEEDGSFLPQSVRGIYNINNHTIQVADNALQTAVPRHEMLHARNRGRVYLDNGKYKMRTKYEDWNDSEEDLRNYADQEEIDRMKRLYKYYSDVAEQEPRVLNTLEAMQREGYDINNLSDKQIYNFLYDRPIDMHNSDTQSLIDHYLREDIPAALRGFKNIILPLGFGTIGYGAYNKYAE